MIPYLLQDGQLGASLPDFDEFISSVVALLHCDGSNGSTTFTDSSRYARAFTAGGGTQVSTTNPKHGSGSASFSSASTSRLSATASIDTRFPGDFTVEAWINPTSNPASDHIYDSRTTGLSAAGFVIFRSSGKLAVFSGSQVITGTTTLSLSTQAHVALCRSGTATKLFLNGTQEGSTWTATANFSDGQCYLGGEFDGTSGTYTGLMDEIRITKGVARYTANFTPPAGPFPNS